MRRHFSQKKQTYRWCLKHKVFAVGKPGKWLIHCLFFAGIWPPQPEVQTVSRPPPHPPSKGKGKISPSTCHTPPLSAPSVHIAAKWNTEPLITQEDSPALLLEVSHVYYSVYSTSPPRMEKHTCSNISFIVDHTAALGILLRTQSWLQYRCSEVNNLVPITADSHRCEGRIRLSESVGAVLIKTPQIPAAWYLRFKEKRGLKGLTKISRVTDNLCLEIKAGPNWEALRGRLWWQSQWKEECWARGRDGQRASEAAMLFTQGDECWRGPASRCKVPLQEIIHGGFRIEGVKVLCVAHYTHSHSRAPLPRSLSISQ